MIALDYIYFKGRRDVHFALISYVLYLIYELAYVCMLADVVKADGNYHCVGQ